LDPKGTTAVNDSQKFPWLSRLVAAIEVALVLIVVVIDGTLHVINEFATVADTYRP
jgi:hypothetical protein